MAKVKNKRDKKTPETFDDAIEVLENVAVHEEGQAKNFVQEKKNRLQHFLNPREQIQDNPWPYIVGLSGIIGFFSWLFYRHLQEERNFS